MLRLRYTRESELSYLRREEKIVIDLSHPKIGGPRLKGIRTSNGIHLLGNTFGACQIRAESSS